PISKMDYHPAEHISHSCLCICSSKSRRHIPVEEKPHARLSDGRYFVGAVPCVVDLIKADYQDFRPIDDLTPTRCRLALYPASIAGCLIQSSAKMSFEIVVQ